jgi:apolipoprotein N-acyltransferase
MSRILKPLTYILAALYFLIDAVFMTVARPVANWIASHVMFRRLRAWIRSLSPYASLALFSVPVMILEPVKPLAAYLAATGQWLVSAVTLIVGELLKLVLVERLFSLTRDKLMTIPAFAFAYGKFQDMKAWLEATEAWRAMRRLSRMARDSVAQIKATLSHRSVSFEGERRRS